MDRKPKIFVLDTNIILHDHRAIYNFQDNDLFIPIAVIEELDNFKKGNDNLSFHARNFIREIDRLSHSSSFADGVPIAPGKGKIKVEMSHPFPQEYEGALIEDIPDHRIIATALWVRDHYPDRKVALVTKDMNMRLKARAMGMDVQDYLSDKIEDSRIAKMNKAPNAFKKVAIQIIKRFIFEGSIPTAEISPKRKFSPNQLLKLFSEDGTIHLGRYDAAKKAIVRVTSDRILNITPRNDEQAFVLEALLNPNVQLISITGAAGSGKTLLSLVGAMAQADKYDQIILTRPIFSLLDKNGLITPEKMEKMVASYLLPLHDNYNLIKGEVGDNGKKLIISPLSYLRGRSLNHTCFIVDEAQNLSPHEIKTIVSRAGEGTKIIFTGDTFQIDQPYLDPYSNGLTLLNQKFEGSPIFEHINMTKGERSELSKLANKLL